MTTKAASKTFTWEKADVERLVDWMEENQMALRGSKSTWVKDCKEQVFKENVNVTAERIGIKHNNLKASWIAGKKKLESSGWGSKDGETIERELEKKYPFYRRLDEIFGSRPNASLGTFQDTLPDLTQDTTMQDMEDSTASNKGKSRGDEDIEWEATQSEATRSEATRSEATQSRAQHSRSSSITSQVISGGSASGSPSPGMSGSTKKGWGKLDSVKRLMEEKQSYELERELKKTRIEQQMQRERLEAENTRFLTEKEETRMLQRERLEAEERLARITASTAAEVAKIQADAQVRQFELMAQILGHGSRKSSRTSRRDSHRSGSGRSGSGSQRSGRGSGHSSKSGTSQH